jgi:hypothetical protein
MESPCKHISRILILLTLLCVAAFRPAFGQSFTVKDLGTLPGGIFSQARGINDRGQVVGAAATSHELALVYERERQRGNKNRATLAVARKMVAYMLAVERKKQAA